ncbi:calmodulin-binding transcription activator CBT isoform X2 [Phoenix dactylifera]|uniref:Calmodulin-binding transcription activator CBT isoform X2 n=1 Tax=Phoenix dactylifera TaxID=42345 RepID=A0A8B8ZI14_PHODC|nr:calmodulin-binding transcription activator CBT isoform X2 [Phoenix dactylifera]
MEAGDSASLDGTEIHGFQTKADLRIEKLMEDASARWLRPNEVHAILSNYTLFKIQPQPTENPRSITLALLPSKDCGTILLFDRKMLRNFRKDGHNWKKKKDGKTVQEAHEKLKIGNEERIHVYYARSEDDPNFYRRCYWLLDKKLERIVLVHYRQTSEENASQNPSTPVECTEALSLTNRMHHGSPSTPINSSGSAHSELSGSAVMSEEINSREDHAINTGSGISLADNCNELWNHELSLHEINTLDWEDLVEPQTSTVSMLGREGVASSSVQQMPDGFRNSVNNHSFLPSHDVVEGVTSSGHPTDVTNGNGIIGVNHVNGGYFQTAKNQENPSPLFKTMNPTSQVADIKLDSVHSSASPDIFTGDVFLAQNSFGRWNCMNDDSLGFVADQLEALNSSGDKSNAFTIMDQSSTAEQVFSITDISPGWAYSTEETKVLVVGHFNEPYKHLMTSNIYCVFGEMHAAAEMIQAGVYHCTAMPHPPGSVNFFMTLDGYTPISQVLSFDYRSAPSVKLNGGVTSSEDDNNNLKWKEFQVQARLAHLLFSTTDNISIQSNRIQSKSLKEAKRYLSATSPLMAKDWMNLLRLSSNSEALHVPATQDLFELVLKNKLQEWILEKVAEGCKTTSLDSQGQGVIHLCAILDYAWAARLFALSGMSLDFRDASGWTALHWAAYFGREKMVAALLSVGANPSLVTDPTSEFPGGCTAADLASNQGYEGLAAYLAEKGLTAHFQAMSLSGNISVPLSPSSTNQVSSENVYAENLTEQELCLKESLAAYRNAADAADRIQAAFRERALKQQTKAVQLDKPEIEAVQIVAALKIQHAFRNHSRRRMLKAAARIQSHFRTWKIRRHFLNMRKQAIKIQAVFRGHQVRKQYCKIIWSVGVLEKAILRWRLKRKGLRGIQVESKEAMKVDTEEESTEEDFFRISREQAEERVKRSVIRVQAMFRSHRAQQEYRRMKLAHEQANLEFNELDQWP